MLSKAYQPVDPIWLYLLVTGALIVLMTYTWQFRKMPGAKQQVCLQGCKAVWLVSMILIGVNHELADKLIAYRLNLLAGNDNYTLSYIGNFLTINLATLTVKANDVSRYYGYENPAFTYTVVSGLIGSHTKTDVVQNLALTTTAIRTSPVAQYDITLGDKQISSNYALNFIPGKLTVNQAPGQYNSYQGAVSYVYRLADQSAR